MLWKQRSGESEMIVQVSHLIVRERKWRMTTRKVMVKISLTQTMAVMAMPTPMEAVIVIAVIVQAMKKQLRN
jgi:hypothetical protein